MVFGRPINTKINNYFKKENLGSKIEETREYVKEHCLSSREALSRLISEDVLNDRKKKKSKFPIAKNAEILSRPAVVLKFHMQRMISKRERVGDEGHIKNWSVFQKTTSLNDNEFRRIIIFQKLFRVLPLPPSATALF